MSSTVAKTWKVREDDEHFLVLFFFGLFSNTDNLFSR